MLNKKGNVRTSGKEKHEVVKPVPPNDLWEQLDVALQEVKVIRPPDSFTKAEFMEKRGVTVDRASKLLYALIRADKIRREGSGSNTYYVLVKDK